MIIRFATSHTVALVCLVNICFNDNSVAWPVAPEMSSWSGPIGFEYVGGTASNFPMSGGPDSGAPEIAMISEIGFSGDSLAVTGRGFEDVVFKLWNGDQTTSVIPITTGYVEVDAGADRAALTLPAGLPKSTYFIWPTKVVGDTELVGTPIRVNAPQVTWSYPSEIRRIGSTAGINLKVFGRNLAKPGRRTYAVIEGGSTFLLNALPSTDPILPVSAPGEVEARVEPYHLDITLPDLNPGTYQLRVYSGGGGKFGWSEPFPIKVVSATAVNNGHYFVSSYYAAANDGVDDTQQLQNAIDAAFSAGGGTVRLHAGEYNISYPLQLKQGVTIDGVGVATYNPETRSVDVNTSNTLIRFKATTPHPNPPASLIEITGADCGIRELTLLNDNTGHDQSVVKISGENARRIKIRDTIFVVHDKRRWRENQTINAGIPAPYEDTYLPYNTTLLDNGFIDDGALWVDTYGPVDLSVSTCKFYTPGPGIQLGQLQPSWNSMEQHLPSTDSVEIVNCTFRGTYAGEPNRQKNASASGRAVGVFLANAKRVSVQGCDFAGVAKTQRAIMCRTLLAFNSANRFFQFAHNYSENVGSHPSAVNMDANQGEQYLFHWRHPFSGIFFVTSAGSDFVRVRINYIDEDPDEDDPHYFRDHVNSRILSGVGERVGQDYHWIAFISKGKGAGQYREIVSKEPYSTYAMRLNLDRPWRVVPDATSRINVIPAYRDLVLYNNYLDGGPGDPTHKIHGPTLYFEAFGNHMVKNTIKRVTAGVIFASRYRSPSAWNYALENIIEDIVDGYTGDTAKEPCALNDQIYQTTPEWPAEENPATYDIGQVWYSVGNVFRGNICNEVINGITVRARYTGRARTNIPNPVEHVGAGMMLNIIEKNTIDAVRGMTFSLPVNGAYVNNNTIIASEGDYFQDVIGEDGGPGIIIIDGVPWEPGIP